ncbi:MAG TPA: hypothetical protein VGT08_19480 [Terracidiphilus sp.]|nr:hypothetical protein [Terracidiphilus sp.]
MNAHNNDDRIKHLLRQALPPVEAETGPSRNLWPAVLRRLDAQTVGKPRINWVWLDWALLAGVLAVTVAFPASIPMLLYYL